MVSVSLLFLTGFILSARGYESPRTQPPIHQRMGENLSKQDFKRHKENPAPYVESNGERYGYNKESPDRRVWHKRGPNFGHEDFARKTQTPNRSCRCGEESDYAAYGEGARTSSVAVDTGRPWNHRVGQTIVDNISQWNSHQKLTRQSKRQAPYVPHHWNVRQQQKDHLGTTQFGNWPRQKFPKQQYPKHKQYTFYKDDSQLKHEGKIHQERSTSETVSELRNTRVPPNNRFERNVPENQKFNRHRESRQEKNSPCRENESSVPDQSWSAHQKCRGKNCNYEQKSETFKHQKVSPSRDAPQKIKDRNYNKRKENSVRSNADQNTCERQYNKAPRQHQRHHDKSRQDKHVTSNKERNMTKDVVDQPVSSQPVATVEKPNASNEGDEPQTEEDNSSAESLSA